MIEQILLKLGLILIDTLVKDQQEKAETKRRLIESTARYNRTVLDSVLIRREWDELKRAFDSKPGGAP